MTGRLVIGERSQHTVKRIADMIGQEPARIRDISVRIHMHFRHVGRVIHTLHKRREVHIARWERDETSNYPITVWGWGDKPDAKKPSASNAARGKRYRAKMKKEDPERHLRIIHMKRAKRLKPKRDIAASWIVPARHEETDSHQPACSAQQLQDGGARAGDHGEDVQVERVRDIGRSFWPMPDRVLA